MDTDVLHNLDLFQSSNNKFDSIIASASCISPFSALSFWDRAEDTVDSHLIEARASDAQQGPTPQGASRAAAPSGPVPPSRNCAERARATKARKRQPTPVNKRPRLSRDQDQEQDQDRSPLDCPDYWLRFDSDDDSLDQEYEADPAAIARRRFATPRSSFASASSRLAPLLPFTADDFRPDDSALEHALPDEADSPSAIYREDTVLDGMSRTDMGRSADGDGDAEADADAAAPEPSFPSLNWGAGLEDWEGAGQPQQSLISIDAFTAAAEPALNDGERQRMISVALGSGFDADSGPPPSHQPATHQDITIIRNPGGTKRSSPGRLPHLPGTATPGGERSEKAVGPKAKGGDRAAHNDIERKYRTNLKDRIAELREAVPELRSKPDGHEDAGSPLPASGPAKVSKGTVLTKATEYIQQLEQRNRSMSRKNEELARRLQALERRLLVAGPGTTITTSWQPQGYG